MSGTIVDNILRQSGSIAATPAGLSWQDVVTASTVTVDAVTTAVDQSRPPGVAAIVPDALATLFTIIPLIIFSYALNEYPRAGDHSLAVPTPVTSAAITPRLFTKFDLLT